MTNDAELARWRLHSLACMHLGYKLEAKRCPRCLRTQRVMLRRPGIPKLDENQILFWTLYGSAGFFA